MMPLLQLEHPDRPPPLVLKCQLAATEHGMSLLSLLSRRFPYHTQEEWQTLLQQGLVRLNGRTPQAGQLVRAGDQLTYRAEDIQEPEVPTHFEKILETADLLLVGKPAGTPVTRTGLIVRQTLVNILRNHYLQEIHPLHRLDRETSGLLLCARNREGVRHYQSRDRTLRLGKYYLALVRGRLEVDRLKVTLALAPRPESPIRCRMWPDSGGKPCQSVFHTIATAADFTLVLAELETGRRHQLRAHLAHLGHPLIGDKIYSHDGRYFLKRLDGELTAEDFVELGARQQTLHAWAVHIQLPGRPANLYFSRLFSEDFQRYLRLLPGWQIRARQLLGRVTGTARPLPENE